MPIVSHYIQLLRNIIYRYNCLHPPEHHFSTFPGKKITHLWTKGNTYPHVGKIGIPYQPIQPHRFVLFPFGNLESTTSTHLRFPSWHIIIDSSYVYRTVLKKPMDSSQGHHFPISSLPWYPSELGHHWTIHHIIISLAWNKTYPLICSQGHRWSMLIHHLLATIEFKIQYHLEASDPSWDI